MKRSKSINLTSMRKAPLLWKPLSASIALLSLVACGSGQQTEEVFLALNPNDCADKTELTLEQCEVAYQQAQAEAERTAPRFASRDDCYAEYGSGNCRQSNSGGFFMPFMAGYMVSSLISDMTYPRYYNPVYSRYDRSRGYGTIVTGSGYPLRDSYGNGSYRVPASSTKAQAPAKIKPKVTKTVSKGGFGSSASAKSSWGSSKFSGGWGG